MTDARKALQGYSDVELREDSPGVRKRMVSQRTGELVQAVLNKTEAPGDRKKRTHEGSHCASRPSSGGMEEGPMRDREVIRSRRPEVIVFITRGDRNQETGRGSAGYQLRHFTPYHHNTLQL